MLPEVEDNEDMEFGREAESFIRDWFGRKLGVQTSTFPYIMQSVDYPWMLANIDGLVNDGKVRLLEIKTAGPWARKEWEEGIPDAYRAQVQHYMTVTGIDSAYVVGLVGKKLFWHLQEYNAELAAQIVEAEQALWEMIENNEMPAPIGIDAEVEALTYGDVDPDAVEEGDDEAVALYQEASIMIKELEKRKTELKADMLYKMGSAKTLITPTYKVLHLQSEREYFDKKAFQKEFPDIYQRFAERRRTDMGLRVYEVKK